MANVQITLTIPPDLQKALGTNLAPKLRELTKALADELKAFISPYPPAGIGNMPRRPGSWYERGQGLWYAYKDGRTILRKSSEIMGERWKITQYQSTGAQLRNDASYVRWVHDADNQAWMHRAHGWVTDKQARERLEGSGDIDRLVNQMWQDVGLA